MAFRIIFLEEFGKAFVPKRAIPHLRLFLLKAGISYVPYKFFGALFYLTALITAIIYLFFVYPFLLQYSQLVLLVASAISWFIIQISLATFFILLVYFYVDLRIYRRTKKMEETLPDFLQVVASNLKGGLSFEKALLGAIKPRFTILANEMAEVSKKVMTGHDVSIALYELGQKYDSPMLKRSIDLMVGELESGGQIANLIDKIVRRIKETKVLKEEISASAVAYMIFMAAIVIFIAPLLFALSYNLLIVILSFISKLSVVTARAGTLPFSVSGMAIEPDNFKYFSIAALAVISFFSSLIVSIVEKGNIKSGLKYIPIFLIGSLAFYFIFMKVLSFVFSGLTF
ncbi:MAG: type II secretion system F family protein [Candidatus Woesearchaeota archaeon]|jgi:pilus assembly protein TadC|nr:type II secretion system F family protein [Candidatus Woesearchaeota archaeon]|tara:strand:- start:52 stop:1080 length:1029 start_codon:yes stop_codon:yes gene_type:complete